MTATIAPAKLPVILLYHIDPGWTPAEKDETIRQSAELGDALRSKGHPTTMVTVTDEDIAVPLRPFDPAKYIVFNWCEELPGIPHSEWKVAKQLESLGYTLPVPIRPRCCWRRTNSG